MTEPEPDESILEIASEVADATPVDWGRARTDSPDLEPALRRLEAIESIARAFAQTVPDEEGSGVPFPGGGRPLPCLFEWGHLRAVRKLGQGSFGEVFEAYDPTLQRNVALKLRRAEPGGPQSAVLQWLDEARRLARVRHPNVLVVYGADLRDGRAGMWTELVSGRTLEEWLEDQGPLGPREAALLGLDLCAALSAVHAAGLVHGDLKTRNVMRAGGRDLDSTGTGRIVLMDFGAARESGDPGSAAGTPLTSAPEVLRGDPATPASDIYSLGVLLYRMLTGRYPVEPGSVTELTDRLVRGDVRPLRSARPDLPRELVEAVDRATAVEASNRFPDAASMESALARVIAAAPGVVRSRKGIGWAAVLTLAGIGLVLAWVRPWPNSEFASRASRDNRPADIRDTVAAGGDVAAEGASPARAPVVSSPDPVPARQPALAPRVDATLLRRDVAGGQSLRSGDRLRPGDRLYLEMEADEAVHVYVLNEDAGGNVHVLFPLSGSDAVNPLSPGILYRLPGSRGGARLDWLVTSAEGRETFLLLASRSSVAALDSVVRILPRALEGAPVIYARLRPEDLASMRGVGGVVPDSTPASGSGEGQLRALSRELAGVSRPAPLWIRLLVLENPAP